MKTLYELEDKELIAAIDIRWKDSDTLWSKMKEWGDHNRQYWRNSWEDHIRSARKLSKVKDNRIFLSIEHDVNILTARPAKPIVMPAKETDPDSRNVAQGLQHMFLELYRKRQVKKKLKRGIRYLHFDRLLCLYPFWNTELNDVDVRIVNPKNIRIPRNASSPDEAEWIAEEIEEPLSALLVKCREKEEDIKKALNYNDDYIAKQNPNVKYKMFWTPQFVAYILNSTVFKKINNPTWDFEGLVIEPQEMAVLEKLSGLARRPQLERIKNEQANRTYENTNQETGEVEMKKKAPTFFYNHFDKPRIPYIWGTIFEDGDGPLGATDLIHQAGPLQDNINRRKRQIDDNAEDAGGIFLFDSKSFTKEDVQKFSGKAGTRLYGSNIDRGFKRDTGRELPSYIFQDLEHSTREVDNIFATQGIVRGEREGKETAQGRAMLREASLQRREEIIDLIDYVTWELYNWWLQLIKLNYTEIHYVKPLGFSVAAQTLEIMQDDIEDGIDLRIMPGQVVPDDKIYRQERSKEEFDAGLLSPLDYHRESGREDPEGITKRLVLFKVNPLSLIEMTEEEKSQLTVGQNASAQAVEGGDALGEIQQYLQSEEFKALPPEQQQEIMGRIRNKVGELKQ